MGCGTLGDNQARVKHDNGDADARCWTIKHRCSETILDPCVDVAGLCENSILQCTRTLVKQTLVGSLSLPRQSSQTPPPTSCSVSCALPGPQVMPPWNFSLCRGACSRVSCNTKKRQQLWQEVVQAIQDADMIKSSLNLYCSSHDVVKACMWWLIPCCVVQCWCWYSGTVKQQG